MSREDDILNWLSFGQTGESSKTLAYRALGKKYKHESYSHPHDPADLNRCLLLMEMLPWVRLHLLEMADVSPEWARLVARWDEVEKTFLDEVGLAWSHGKSAPRTYKLMKDIQGESSEPGLYINGKRVAAGGK